MNELVAGRILATTDGGATWSAQSSGSSADLEDVAFSDTVHGWVVGEGGLVLATTTGGVPPVAPMVVGFTPTSGSAGTVVTLTGSGFGGATAVTFNGTAATSFTVDSDAQITATVPAGATTGKIAVTNPAGTSTSVATFTVPPVLICVTAPTIASSWPSGSTQTVSWTVNPAVIVGEFRVWLVSSGGTWYVNKQVLPVAGQTALQHQRHRRRAGGRRLQGRRLLAPGRGLRHLDDDRQERRLHGHADQHHRAERCHGVAHGQHPVRLLEREPGDEPGEFRVSLISSGGTWYVNKQVLAVSGKTSYTTPVNTLVPAAAGYKAAVYWRAIVGSGTWTATAKSLGFTIAMLAVTDPTAASSWPRNSTQTVAWSVTPGLLGGEFRVSLVSAAGIWYVNKVVAAVPGQTIYSTAIVASVPAAAGYKAAVYWRPVAGTGSWVLTKKSAGFTVTP